MVESNNIREWIVVNDDIIQKVKLAIEAALAYEAATNWNRKLGITGEVGEILVCHQLGLRLMLDPRSVGYDALDPGGRRVQIKTRRSESEGLPRDAGRVSSFSGYEFDYALLGLLDHQYRLCEIWQADYDDLMPIIDKQKRRNPNLSLFKRVAHRVFP
jgi:hypothetical protein